MLRKYFAWRYGGLPAALPPPVRPWTRVMSLPSFDVRLGHYLRAWLWRAEWWVYRKSGIAAERELVMFGGKLPWT
jgi:hypothetical protein